MRGNQRTLKSRETYFFSYQPFWETERENETLIRTQEEKLPIQAMELLMSRKGEETGIDSIPGTGQVGINFSLCEKEASAYVFGVLKEKKRLAMYGVSHSLMLRFMPGQFARIVGLPANEIPAEGVPLTDLLPETGAIIEAMNESDSPEERERLIRAFLGLCGEHRRRRSDCEERTVAGMVHYMMKERRIIRVGELEREFGYSARMLQKITLRNVGICPKQMNTQICMQEAVRCLEEQPHRSVAELGCNLGFYDQSHFTAAFKKTTGCTPGEFKFQVAEKSGQAGELF